MFSKVFGLVLFFTTTIQLAINGIVILVEENVQVLNTYDFGLIVTSTNTNSIMLGSLVIILSALLFLWSFVIMAKVANEIMKRV